MEPDPLSRPILVVVGPTASGKTEVVERLGQHLSRVDMPHRPRMEAVAADAMQVYRGMDIGTAKPRGGTVTYHCVDIVEPTETYSVARYQATALAAVEDIANRGLLPVVVGGSGLYVRAVVDGLEFAPGAPEGEARGRLLALAESAGPDVLYERLMTEDPKAARKIHPGNVRRVIRALEWLESGRRPSERHAAFGQRPDLDNVWMVGMSVPRKELTERIAERVEDMLADGLAAEARKLWDADKLGPTARQAIGYKEFVDHFQGRVTWEDAVERIVTRTRQYAKRQITWFGRDDRVEWVAGEDPEAVAAHLIRGLVARGWVPSGMDDD
jgi:tRNA dimethylallyltransferase